MAIDGGVGRGDDGDLTSFGVQRRLQQGGGARRGDGDNLAGGRRAMATTNSRLVLEGLVREKKLS